MQNKSPRQSYQKRIFFHIFGFKKVLQMNNKIRTNFCQNTVNKFPKTQKSIMMEKRKRIVIAKVESKLYSKNKLFMFFSMAFNCFGLTF